MVPDPCSQLFPPVHTCLTYVSTLSCSLMDSTSKPSPKDFLLFVCRSFFLIVGVSLLDMRTLLKYSFSVEKNVSLVFKVTSFIL